MKFCPTGTLGQSLYFFKSHVFMSKCPHLETGNLDICFKSIVIRMKRDVVWEGLYIVRDQPAPIFSPPSILHFSPTSVSAPLEGRQGAPSPLWMHRAHQPCPANRGRSQMVQTTASHLVSKSRGTNWPGAKIQAFMMPFHPPTPSALCDHLPLPGHSYPYPFPPFFLVS